MLLSRLLPHLSYSVIYYPVAKAAALEVITKPDKKKLLADLKLGEVEGARIERGEQSLRIK